MKLYQEKQFKEISKELQQERNHKLSFKKSDYDTILKARITGDWSPVYKLDFYINHGGDYCSLLQLLPHHQVRLLFCPSNKQDNEYIVFNKDRIFNNDYLHIATISPNNEIIEKSHFLYDLERLHIQNYIAENFKIKSAS